MRLICPSCGAQYAVGDDVIPEGGRDVQCSNCSHTWFETPGAPSNDMASKSRTPRPDPTAPSASKPSQYEGPIADAFKRDGENLSPAPKAPASRRTTVDPSVASILQEEAARETAKRRLEAPAPIEGQSDLGLHEPAKPTRRPDPVERSAAARTAAAATGAVAAAATDGAHRRELLPDIEDINSSLRSDSERAESGDLAAHNADQKEQNRRGFRRGFFLVLLLIAILVVIYLRADAIKNAVPALAQQIDAYVAAVDAGRTWLDDTVRAMLTPADETTPES